MLPWLLLFAAAMFVLSFPLAIWPSQPAPAQKTDGYGDALPPAAIARLGTLRFQHGGKHLLGFSTDGRELLRNFFSLMRSGG